MRSMFTYNLSDLVGVAIILFCVVFILAAWVYYSVSNAIKKIRKAMKNDK